MNFSLLTKWWWKLEQESGMWHEIIHAKYLKNKTIFSVTHKASDSPIWYDMLKVKDLYLQGRGVEIKDGRKTRFWYDSWLYDKPILFIVPTLFILCVQKDVCVADVKSGRITLTFKRWLTDELLSC
jgi:hypothetical protein